MTMPITFDGQNHREMTPEEFAQYEADTATAQAAAAKAEAKASARQNALAKLAALGLTEDEVNAIIGGI